MSLEVPPFRAIVSGHSWTARRRAPPADGSRRSCDPPSFREADEMWILLALAAALFQVLRNTVMKRLGHSLDEYINVWGRFTFLLPFALIMALLHGFPTLKPGFVPICLLFGLCQTCSTLALS